MMPEEVSTVPYNLVPLLRHELWLYALMLM